MASAKELRDVAKNLKIRGYSQMRKAELEAAIESHVGGDQPDQVAPVAPAEDKAPVAPVAPAKEKKARKPSAWVEFCKEHSKEKGISYRDAMQCKDEYASWKGEKAKANAEESAE